MEISLQLTSTVVFLVLLGLSFRETTFLVLISVFLRCFRDLTYDKHFENMSFFRLGLHPYKLATLRVTIGLIITSSYRIKLIKIKGFVTSQKHLWPAINFLM